MVQDAGYCGVPCHSSPYSKACFSVLMSIMYQYSFVLKERNMRYGRHFSSMQFDFLQITITLYFVDLGENSSVKIEGRAGVSGTIFTL